MKLLTRPQVPFTEQRGPISRCAEMIRDCSLGQRQSQRVTHRRASIRIKLVPKPLGIAAGHQTRTSWAAVRPANVRIRKADPAAGESVDVRGWDIRAAMDSNVGISHIV